MKVSARDDVAFSLFRIRNEDQRIVDRGIGFGLKHLAAVGERISHSPVHLWDAAQRVSILHAAAIAVRFTNLATFQHFPQVRSCFHLTRVRTRLVNAFVECCVRPLKRVAAQSAQNVCGIHKCFGGQQSQRSDRQHCLRPVDQRDRLLRLEHQRLDLGSLQCVCAGDAHALLVEALAFADEGKSKMR